MHRLIVNYHLWELWLLMISTLVNNNIFFIEKKNENVFKKNKKMIMFQFKKGTQAAVAGGTTCLLDFVIPMKGMVRIWFFFYIIFV